MPPRGAAPPGPWRWGAGPFAAGAAVVYWDARAGVARAATVRSVDDNVAPPAYVVDVAGLAEPRDTELGRLARPLPAGEAGARPASPVPLRRTPSASSRGRADEASPLRATRSASRAAGLVAAPSGPYRRDDAVLYTTASARQVEAVVLAASDPEYSIRRLDKEDLPVVDTLRQRLSRRRRPEPARPAGAAGRGVPATFLLVLVVVGALLLLLARRLLV